MHTSYTYISIHVQTLLPRSIINIISTIHGILFISSNYLILFQGCDLVFKPFQFLYQYSREKRYHTSMSIQAISILP